jgi:cation diffusion facilitator CzcD-associated flavoprotein CzcO
MDKDHVNLIDLKKSPVSHVVPEGIVTADGKVHELDILAIATGFDSMTGGYNDIDITGLEGEKLKQKWEKGVYTYLGISSNNIPNFFFTYGPQSPCAYGNGPSIVEPQGDWIVDVMKQMREKGQTRINPQKQAELDWKQTINKLHAMSVRDRVDSWYMGSNVEGKPREALNYAGGLPAYLESLGATSGTLEGFDVS